MKKTKLLNILSILVLISFVSAHTGDDNYGHHMMGNVIGMNGMWGMGIFGWIFAILILVALVLLIVWLVKQIQKK